MSVWGDVFDGLNSMSLPQLLLAYIAGTAYLLAQGELTPRRGRHIAALTALVAAILFVVLGDGWERNTMLVVLAVGGIGIFIALAWISAHLLGLGHEPLAWSESMLAGDLSGAAAPASNSARPAPLHAGAAQHTGGPTAVG